MVSRRGEGEAVSCHRHTRTATTVQATSHFRALKKVLGVICLLFEPYWSCAAVAALIPLAGN